MYEMKNQPNIGNVWNGLVLHMGHAESGPTLYTGDSIFYVTHKLRFQRSCKDRSRVGRYWIVLAEWNHAQQAEKASHSTVDASHSAVSHTECMKEEYIAIVIQ